MAIKCGRGHRHESVAEVRACYDVPPSTRETSGFQSNRFAGACSKCGGNVPKRAGRVDKVSGKWQLSHVECPSQPEKIETKFQGGPNERYAQIPRGHYATNSLSGNNDFDFWRVDRPEQGAYAGRTFVKRIVGGKPDLNVSRSTKFAALEAILSEGIEVTGTRYGQELGQCRACNRRLTDETSRELGIGPECRSKGK